MKRRPFSVSMTGNTQLPVPKQNNGKIINRAASASFRRMESARGGAAAAAADSSSNASFLEEKEEVQKNDIPNYALLIALYTLQGIPMGLSASIPFLIQQKVKLMASAAASAATAGGAAAAGAAAGAAASSAAAHHPNVAKMAYNAQAIFALCSWPFSLKLLWAPIVDAVFSKRFGRRKSWLVPVQAAAGLVMITGSDYVEQQLGLGELEKLSSPPEVVKKAADAVISKMAESATFDVKGVTAFFFVLYFLMATQDIALDGWALTMLSKRNRGRGPVCNSIGQNLGYFLSFVGFLALNDAESSENLWRPLLRLKSNPGVGLVSLGGFIKSMGVFMIVMTTFVALFKREDAYVAATSASSSSNGNEAYDALLTPERTKRKKKRKEEDDEDAELDAAQIGLAETYHRLYAVCKLPSVQWLFLILLTYRLPTALSDNVKFLKAVEFGLSKQTTALLSPTLILPLGIIVPIAAAKIWHGSPLQQFMTAYKFRVTLVPILDVLMLLAVRSFHSSSDASSRSLFWAAVIASTGLQTIVNSLQFNAQMTFFAHRVDPAIGGSYMTLLNTAANLGGTWPSSFVMYLVGQLTVPPDCTLDETSGVEVCIGGRDAYFPLQLTFCVLGCLWIYIMRERVQHIAELPDDAWRTHLDDDDDDEADGTAMDAEHANGTVEMENGKGGLNFWKKKDDKTE